MQDLLIEAADLSSTVNEIVEDSSGKPKSYFISGIYLESDTKNGNGRIYPKDILTREVQKIVDSKIKENRCLGELGHPATSDINLDRVSHIIKELKMDGKQGIGKSLIMNTPMGNIAKALMDAQVKLGVSSRGVGSLKEAIVQDDYRLITIDIVADPSCPAAFVDSIMEKKVIEAVMKEQDVEEIKEKLDKYTVEDRTTALIRVFEEAMAKIGANIKVIR